MMTSTNYLSWSLMVAALGSALMFGGCGGSDDVDPKNSAGSPGTAGSSGSGGSGGGTNSMGEPGAKACPTITDPLILDFSMPQDKSAEITFGDFTTLFSGGTYVYPGVDAMYPLTSDVTTGAWKISGDVGDYSGFGLFFDCKKADASAYKGVSFTISGSVPKGGTVSFSVATAANDIPSSWLNANKANAADPDEVPNFGRCTPGTTNRYDGSCSQPSVSVPVTASAVTHEILWAELTGGRPQASVTASEIVSMQWQLPAPDGAGTAAPTLYAVDVTVDDIKFIE